MGGGLERRRGCWWETRRRTSMLQNASRGIGGEPGEDRRHAASAVSALCWRCWSNSSYRHSLRWYASRTKWGTTGLPPTARWLLAQSCAVSKSALALSAVVQANRASLYNCETGVLVVVVGEERSVAVLTAASAIVTSCSSCRTTASCCLVRACASVVVLALGP